MKGRLKANGVIYRANSDGTELEQYAYGLRNPYAMQISPHGKLICIDQGYDARGSRPVADAPDPMWEIQQNGWYGWPDYVGSVPVSEPRFKPRDGRIPERLLAGHPPVAGNLITSFAPHSSATQFDFSRNPLFGYPGDAFVALFGALSPMTGTVSDHPGHRIVRVDMNTGRIYNFMIPLDHEHGHPPIRPIEAKFSPDGSALYVLDFGRIQVNDAQMTPWAGSGALYRITRTS